MPESNTSENEFLEKLLKITEANLINPQFGVSKLAKEMGMSRSNLHRKVNLELKISVSQFINHERLKKAKEILRHTSKTVSEIAYEVGFNNVSYFIKCFHNYYGYSPGHVGDREETQELSSSAKGRKYLSKIYIAAIAAALIGVVLILVIKPFPFQQKRLEMKIAVLPPEIYETVDTIQIFSIIQSVRNNLGKIKDIEKVTPRQSVLKYKNTTKPATEIAKELDVNYLVKPRIWVHNNDVLLSINLMEGPSDKNLETFEYPIDTNNVTTVHLDIFKDITDKLKISISPEEHGRIEIITSNKKANKYYWEGINYLERPNSIKADQEKAISCFKKAIEHDTEFAAAYAQIAYVYYIMESKWYDSQKSIQQSLYGTQMDVYAVQAYRIDRHLDLSCIAMGLYWRFKKEYKLAIVFFEDAEKYNPNSLYIKNQLFTLYRLAENREKYIELALKFINSPNLYLERNEDDYGIETIYSELGRHYRFLGFFKEAEHYINEALRIKNGYTYASNIKSQIILDLEEENNYERSIDILKSAIAKDPITAMSYRRIGQSYYMLKDYERATKYYSKCMELTGKNWTDGFDIQSKRLAVILRNMGETEKARIQINNYSIFAESLSSATKNFHLSGYFAFLGDTTKALECLKKSSNYDQQYHRLRQLRDDPVYEDYRELPQFQEIISKMETRFKEKRDSIRVVFEKKGFLLFSL